MNIACPHWHRLGERCECGHVTVSARFCRDKTCGISLEKVVSKADRTKSDILGDISHEKAEARYLEFLKDNIPELHERLNRPGPSWDPRARREPVTPPVSVTEPVTSNNPEEKTCDTCLRRFSGYGKECPACRKKRSRVKSPTR